MESTTTIRKHCFMGEDNGLASVAGFSGKVINQNHNHNNNNNNNNNNNGYFVDNQNHMMRRRNSLRNISSISTNVSSSKPTAAVYSPRTGRLFEPRFDEFYSPHFLESCSLCHKPLGGNHDIFMYRGDKPFCSEECRQEQIDVDEVKEKNRKLKVLRTKKEATNSSSKSQNYSFRTGTVVAA